MDFSSDAKALREALNVMITADSYKLIAVFKKYSNADFQQLKTVYRETFNRHLDEDIKVFAFSRITFMLLNLGEDVRRF